MTTNQNSEHTAWSVMPDDERSAYTGIDTGEGDNYTAIELYGPKRHKRARRIVACVNACQGVDTEELERTRNIGDIIEFNAKGAHEQAGLEVEALHLRVTSLEAILRRIIKSTPHSMCWDAEAWAMAESILPPSGPQEA